MEWNGLFIGMEWNGMALDESRGIGAELELAIAILLEWWNCNSNFPDCVELALPEARAGSGSWDGPAAQPA